MSTTAPVPAARGVPTDGSVGWVHSWDISTGVDGPGTRFVVFLTGCPLRCRYCQNPDTWRRGDGRVTPLAKLEARMDRYADFIHLAGGGVTISGGEPLQQPDFTRELMRAARRHGLHTALDTSGFLGRRADDALLDATDLVLLDIKAGTEETHRALTGRPLAPTLEFASRLAERGTAVWVRYVLVPGFTDDPDEVERVARVATAMGCVGRVDVLPFHKLGRSKWERLGRPFTLDDTPTPSVELTARVRDQFAAHGLTAC